MIKIDKIIHSYKPKESVKEIKNFMVNLNEKNTKITHEKFKIQDGIGKSKTKTINHDIIKVKDHKNFDISKIFNKEKKVSTKTKNGFSNYSFKTNTVNKSYSHSSKS